VLAAKGIATSASDVRVEIGIERKEDADIAVAIDSEDQQVAIVVGRDLDLDPVTRPIVATVEGEPDLIIGWQANDPGRCTGRGRGKQGE